MYCYKIKKDKKKYRIWDTCHNRPAYENGWPVDKGGYNTIKEAERTVIALNTRGYRHQ